MEQLLAGSVKLGVSEIPKLAPTWQVTFLVLTVAIFVAEPQRLRESLLSAVVPHSVRLLIPLAVLFLLLFFLSQTWRQRVRHLRQTVSSAAWETDFWVTWTYVTTYCSCVKSPDGVAILPMSVLSWSVYVPLITRWASSWQLYPLGYDVEWGKKQWKYSLLCGWL